MSDRGATVASSDIYGVSGYSDGNTRHGRKTHQKAKFRPARREAGLKLEAVSQSMTYSTA